MEPAYDTLEGITEYVRDLEGLNRLRKDRHAAGYDRKERLREWIVLGHWWADTCGNFGKCEFLLNWRPTAPPASLPPAVLKEDLFKALGGLSIRSGMNSEIPPVRVVCPECSKGWSIEDAHDVYLSIDDVLIPLVDYVGKTLGEVWEEYGERNDAHYFPRPEPSVRNDRFIDLSIREGYDTLKVNERGWTDVVDGAKVDAFYAVRHGDDTTINKWTYFHRECWARHNSAEYRKYYAEIVHEAGFTDTAMEEVPNGYCPCEQCGPWALAKTPFGDIVLGWRKRVISIDWSGTGLSSDTLFEAEDVTKGSTSIHAWGRQKAVEYLARLRGSLIARDVLSGK